MKNLNKIMFAVLFLGYGFVAVALDDLEAQAMMEKIWAKIKEAETASETTFLNYFCEYASRFGVDRSQEDKKWQQYLSDGCDIEKRSQASWDGIRSGRNLPKR